MEKYFEILLLVTATVVAITVLTLLVACSVGIIKEFIDAYKE